MDTRASTRTRLSVLPIFIALLLNLFIGPLSPILDTGINIVSAAPTTVPDEDGPNDEPGQKDLTLLTTDYAGLPTSIFVAFNLDEIDWSGDNTGDGCALFDTDGDLNANYSLCVTVAGAPAALTGVNLYVCEADSWVDRCGGPELVEDPLASTCSVAISNDDPFAAGAAAPLDTKVSCTIQLSDIEAGTVELTNVCSYPSREPNSDPSDCVLIPRDAFLTIVKVATPNDPNVTFAFTNDGASLGSTNGSGSFTEPITGNVEHDVAEVVPAGWTLTSATCDNGDAPSAVDLRPGGTVTCTFNNSRQTGTLTVIKDVENDNGGTATCDDFSFSIDGNTTATNFDASDCTNVLTLATGTYSVTEPAVTGYTTTYANSQNANANCTDLAVANNANVTCTITNDDDEPALTLIKEVDNDNGGDAEATEWTLSATGTGAESTDLSGTTPVSSGAGFKADTYTLAESGGPDGYTAGSWSCVETGTDTTVAVTDSQVTVGLGDDVTCTITNDDQPGTLTVIKEISGGDLACPDFSFTVNEGDPIDFEADCRNDIEVDADTYTVVETDADGYTTTYDNCTEVVIANDGSATCTITNTRQTGSLEVVKVLFPAGDSGRFDLFIMDGETVVGSETNAGNGGSTGTVTLETGTYTVGEEGSEGTSLGNYSSSIECFDGAGEGGPEEVAQGAGAGPLLVDVTHGSEIVCFITNTRVTVGFTKTNNQGENAPVEPGDTIDFTLTVIVANGTATGVEVTDELPDGLTYVPLSADPPEGFSISGQELTWDVETLGAGSHTFEYSATVDADASGSLTNLGCVDADQNDELVCDSTVLLVQNITVTKTNGVTGSIVPGTAVDFTLTLDVINGPIDNVTIVDQLPSGIANATLISDGGTYSAATNRITWNLTNVADNETLTYRAVVSATATAGNLTNVAEITDGPCVGDGCEDTSTVTVRVPTLVADKVASTETITISGPNNALVATPSVVTWTVSYTLTNGPVTGAVITDQVPTGFTFLDAANGGTFANGTVTWNLGTLTTSGSVTFRTTVNPATISRTGPTVNTATIDSNETAPDTGQDSVTVAVVPPVLAGTPPPTPAPLPDTATGLGLNGEPITVPIELLVASFFIGSLGALTLANVKARSRRR